VFGFNTTGLGDIKFGEGFKFSPANFILNTDTSNDTNKEIKPFGGTTITPIFSSQNKDTSEKTDTKEKEKDEDENEKEETQPEEETPNTEFTPVIKLTPIKVETLEEDEDVLYKQRVKLFRHDKEWKERGIGEIKFLKHKITKKIRILMRREKTLKICLNHYLFTQMKLVEMPRSDKAWTWTCPSDFSEEIPRAENFAVRFSTSEMAKEFKTKFEQYQQENTTLDTTTIKTNSTDGGSTRT